MLRLFVMSKETLTVDMRRAPGRPGWVAQPREIEGGRAWGRTLAETKRRVRHALTCAGPEWAACAATVEIEWVVQLPEDAQRAIAARADALEELRRARARVEESTREALRALAPSMSMRELAETLGLSHQRVHQWVRAGGYETMPEEVAATVSEGRCPEGGGV